MSELHSIFKLPPTTQEKMDNVCALSVATRSIVDAALHSQNSLYRRAVLPYLNLFVRTESGYRNARALLGNKTEKSIGLSMATPDVFVERTGPEVSAAIIFGAVHRVASHKTDKIKSREDIVAEGVLLEAWNTRDSSSNLADLYANGIVKIREKFGDVPIYTVERVPSPDERQSRLRGRVFDPAITEAIETTSLQVSYTGYISRDDMYGMKPVFANVYAAQPLIAID